jgi:AraC family transcriptional regulator
MTATSLVNHFHVRDASSVPAEWRAPESFSILRLESECGLTDRINKVASVPAVLVSVSIKALARHDYQLWVDHKVVPTPTIAAFRTNVVDLDAKPSCWAGSKFDYMHYHVPRNGLDDIAADLGAGAVNSYKLAVVEEDLVLAQFTKNILPHVGRSGWPSELSLGYLQLILGAHLLQRYAGVRKPLRPSGRGLGARQKRRALELLNENLAGRITLTRLAGECGLSPSHFARSFKASVGFSAHQWLARKRIERSKELLVGTDESLAVIAYRTGFADQAAFTRAFREAVGSSPGRWRRDNARTLPTSLPRAELRSEPTKRA